MSKLYYSSSARLCRPECTTSSFSSSTIPNSFSPSLWNLVDATIVKRDSTMVIPIAARNTKTVVITKTTNASMLRGLVSVKMHCSDEVVTQHVHTAGSSGGGATAVLLVLLALSLGGSMGACFLRQLLSLPRTAVIHIPHVGYLTETTRFIVAVSPPLLLVSDTRHSE